MNRVKEFRKQAGLTQAELARRAGLNRNTIACLEKKSSKLQDMTATCISKVLSVPVPVLRGEATEVYGWKHGEEHWPQKEGRYLVAYQPKNRKGCDLMVLTWHDKGWWMTTLDGRPIVEVKPDNLWWSEINLPPI